MVTVVHIQTFAFMVKPRFFWKLQRSKPYVVVPRTSSCFPWNDLWLRLRRALHQTFFEKPTFPEMPTRCEVGEATPGGAIGLPQADGSRIDGQDRPRDFISTQLDLINLVVCLSSPIVSCLSFPSKHVTCDPLDLG